MLPQRLAFVDIETTGLSVIRDRIIEIGILRVEDDKITQTFQTLLNPHMYISPFIEDITGISKKELETAPAFEDIHRIIKELLDDCIFVAHNVRFDYGFIRNEFRRCEIKFSAKHFCTAKLSRKLFPKHKRHNLDSIIDRFGIVCKKRHRAFDDAKVLWDFFQVLQKQVPEEQLETALAFGLKKPSLPAELHPKYIENLPDTSGVYIFYGEKEIPLYVGKSKNLKERIFSHFSNDHTSTKEMNMCRQIRAIETIETAGELGALIKESLLIKQLQPIYNRKLRTSRKLTVLRSQTKISGYQTVSIDIVDEITSSDLSGIIGIYRSKQQAKNFLIEQAKKYQLCEKLLGLEKTNTACFGYRLNLCNGACLTKENPLRYNMRFIQAFSQYKLKSWPFPGSIVIKEKSDYDNKEEHIIIDNWCLIGQKGFDLDMYKILIRYLQEPKNYNTIMVYGKKENLAY